MSTQKSEARTSVYDVPLPRRVQLASFTRSVAHPVADFSYAAPAAAPDDAVIDIDAAFAEVAQLHGREALEWAELGVGIANETWPTE